MRSKNRNRKIFLHKIIEKQCDKILNINFIYFCFIKIFRIISIFISLSLATIKLMYDKK